MQTHSLRLFNVAKQSTAKQNKKYLLAIIFFIHSLSNSLSRLDLIVYIFSLLRNILSHLHCNKSRRILAFFKHLIEVLLISQNTQFTQNTLNVITLTSSR